MKCSTRCSLLLCCFLFLFTLCSVPVSAEDIDTSNYHALVSIDYLHTTGSLINIDSFITFFGDSGSEDIGGGSGFSYVTLGDTSDFDGQTKVTYSITNEGSTILFYKKRSVTLSLHNLQTTHKYGHLTEEFYNVSSFNFQLEYTDGTLSQIYDTVSITYEGGNKHNYKLEFTPEKDVKKVHLYEFVVHGEQQAWWDNCIMTGTVYKSNYEVEVWNPGDWLIVADQSSEEAGLLSGILGGITSGFTDLFNGITNVFNAVRDLPGQIWSFIENGLKGLFVPYEEYMAGYKQKWEDLLADRLGAVYQVVQITFGAWEDIETADQINTINIPVVTIPLLDNQSFSFGGYDVKIVPDGFDILVTALKSIVGIVCTIMFINGLRKRYDEIMGVEQ